MNLRLSNFIVYYVDPLNLICPNIIFPSLVSARFFLVNFSPALYFLNAWNRLNVGDFSWSWIFNDFIQLQKEKGKFVDVVHGLVALGGFTSKSCVGRERNVINSVIHVQSCCFAHKSNCFSTLSLSSASSLTVLILSPPRLECRYIEMGIPLEYSWVENLFSDCMTDHLFLKGSADYCL